MKDPGAPKRRGAIRFQTLNRFCDIGAAEAELSASAIVVWLALYRHADVDGKATVPAGRIHAMFGLSRRTITNAIKELTEAKLLKVLAPGLTNGTPAVYRIRPKAPQS